ADIAPTPTTPLISASSAREVDTHTVTTAATSNEIDVTVAYLWQSSTNGSTWTAISGATGTSYQVKESDEGAQLRVLATSSDSDRIGSTACSEGRSAMADIAPMVNTSVILDNSALMRFSLTEIYSA